MIFVTVDHRAPEPAYQQLSSILRAKIAEGEWRTGPLPSVKQLQQEYGVGRDTVLRAIDVLRAEGLVFTVPRRAATLARTRGKAAIGRRLSAVHPVSGMSGLAVQRHEQVKDRSLGEPNGEGGFQASSQQGD